MGYAALFRPYVLYLGSRLRIDANSGLQVLVYTGRAASCSSFLVGRIPIPAALVFSPGLCGMIKLLELSVFFGVRPVRMS